MGNKKDDYEPHPNEAWSWADSKLPAEIERTEERSGVMYYLFHDDRGDLFYQTDRGMRFAEEMEAAVRKGQKERR